MAYTLDPELAGRSSQADGRARGDRAPGWQRRQSDTRRRCPPSALRLWRKAVGFDGY